jgi:hypothetical protein
MYPKRRMAISRLCCASGDVGRDQKRYTKNGAWRQAAGIALPSPNCAYGDQAISAKCRGVPAQSGFLRAMSGLRQYARRSRQLARCKWVSEA